MSAPQRIETERLVLRKPESEDAAAIFARYASDRNVTRFLGWPRHTAVDDTFEFVRFSNAEWQRWPAGPYLIESRESGLLLGSTGLGFESRHRASTGYVLAKDAWRCGYATEALRAIVTVATDVGVRRLYALCHPEHSVSCRVLEKCAFMREATLRRYAEFPNLPAGESGDVLCYSRILP